MFDSGGSATATMAGDAGEYMIESDVDEAAGMVVRSVISSSTAEGEVPQQQCVIESQGGGELGQAIIGPANSVTVDVSVTVADSTFGIVGH